MKTCSTCRVEKPSEDFWKCKRDGLQNNCKECSKESASIWHNDNPTKRKGYERKKALKGFGLTVASFAALLDSQNGVCKICKQANPSGENFAIDHDHKTGKIRGLLCVNCNRGLGFFGDSPERLIAAAAYLEKTS